jgi:hypothetical protein
MRSGIAGAIARPTDPSGLQIHVGAGRIMKTVDNIWTSHRFWLVTIAISSNAIFLGLVDLDRRHITAAVADDTAARLRAVCSNASLLLLAFVPPLAAFEYSGV